MTAYPILISMRSFKWTRRFRWKELSVSYIWLMIIYEGKGKCIYIIQITCLFDLLGESCKRWYICIFYFYLHTKFGLVPSHIYRNILVACWKRVFYNIFLYMLIFFDLWDESSEKLKCRHNLYWYSNEVLLSFMQWIKS